jgi:hypothetical protein
MTSAESSKPSPAAWVAAVAAVATLFVSGILNEPILRFFRQRSHVAPAPSTDADLASALPTPALGARNDSRVSDSAENPPAAAINGDLSEPARSEAAQAAESNSEVTVQGTEESGTYYRYADLSSTVRTDVEIVSVPEN